MCENQKGRAILTIKRNDLIDAVKLGIPLLEELRTFAEDYDEVLVKITE